MTVEGGGTRTPIKRVEVPAREARAVEVDSGDLLRITAHEGPQVGDLFVVAQRDRTKTFSSHITCSLNDRSLRRAERLHAGPPGFEVLLTTVHDTVGIHWIHGRCTDRFYERYDGQADGRNCHANISAALEPYGFAPHETPLDTFNLFMSVHVDQDGHYDFGPPSALKGDFVEFRAEHDVVAVLSACPDEGLLNDFAPKPLLLEVLRES